MRIPSVENFLLSQPRARYESNQTYISCQCPFCGDSHKSDHGHFYVKVELAENEPMWYHCFRAECDAKGKLTKTELEMMGCEDVQIIMDLTSYNQSITSGEKSYYKPFITRTKRDYELVNLDNSINQVKLKYVNHRLGTNFTTSDLRDYKIQLSLYDFLQINGIRRLSFNRQFCDLLNQYTIGFVSIYSDYIILRDISKKEYIGKRYTNYRTSGVATPSDTKIYCIPSEIDLLDPHPACINIGEGAFSILGAYLHTDLGREHRNSLWLANCGSEFKRTLMTVVKQYGLLDVSLHIWSDSEIKIEKYEKLIKEVSDRMNLVSVQVHYNDAAEDFGHAKKDIKVRTVELEGE